MDFLEYIKQLTDEEIVDMVSGIIQESENESRKYNRTDFIGYNISANSENHYASKSHIQLKSRCMYDGYVPRDTKVIYGFVIDNDGLVSNKGMYYKVDDDSYIYDFCKYIKNIDVTSPEDFFEHVLSFLMKYFGTFKFIDRDDMFKTILKDDKTAMEPVKEHKLSKFKGKGNALCSEYAITANNILNVFGIYSCVILGQIKTDDKEEGHAFNLVSYYDNKTGEKVDALVDFSNGVNVYDFEHTKIGDSPYIVYFESIEDIVNGMLNKNMHLTYSDYHYMAIGNSLIQLNRKSERDYFVSNNFTVNVLSKVKQK